MKKFFTLFVLGILGVGNMYAAEEVLWEGNVNISWENPAPSGTVKEWGNPDDGQDITSHCVVGEKLNFYFKADATAEYHAYRFDDWDWKPLPGQVQVDFGGEIMVTLEINDDLANAIAAKGIRIHGHGFSVVKVSKGAIEDSGDSVEDLEAAVLWNGEQEIDGWGGKCLVLTTESEGFNVLTEALKTACNLYFLIENGKGGDFRIAGMWGEWNVTSFPSDGYNHMKTLDADNVLKVTLTQDFVTKAFVEQGGVSFWGNGGFKIKAIGTTKESVLLTTGLNEVRTKKEEVGSQVYDLQGRQIVKGKMQKGLYIINRKKVVLR